MQKYMNKPIWYILFLAPTVICFMIAFVIPFILGIYLSFCDFKTLTNAQFVGFKNYAAIFSDTYFLKSLGRTILFTIVSIISVNFFAFLIALILTKGLKGTNFFRSIFFMPNLVGGIVLGYVFQLVINGVLGLFGLGDITSNSNYGFWGLVLLTNWQLIGYMMIIYIAGLQNVSKDLIEAAEIDGASPFKVLFNVTIPMVMPSITICMFLTLTNAFKMFDQNLALNGAGNKDTMNIALNIYKTMFLENNNEGLGQAKAVVFFILISLIAFIQLKATRSKEVEA